MRSFSIDQIWLFSIPDFIQKESQLIDDDKRFDIIVSDYIEDGSIWEIPVHKYIFNMIKPHFFNDLSAQNLKFIDKFVTFGIEFIEVYDR